ncbi:hypothetical protein H4S14_003561 [Agrobacterium vitis]|nr:hypothetical protein [Agrobacterium vitis]MBE1439796.1 hypothetical protein [Agrobacterium vitis]
MLLDKTSIQATATLLFGILGATISVLTWKGNQDAYCISSVQTFVDVSRQAYLSLPSDHYTNPLMKRIVDDCGYKREELLQLLGSHADHVTNVDVNLQPQSDAKTANPAPQKWVLLGIADGAANFSRNGAATPMAQWQKGDQLTAQDDVNVRRSFANWSAPLNVIGKGDIVTLANAPVEVPADDKTQYWGRLQ